MFAWTASVAGVAFACGLLLMVELAGTHWFWPWVFRLGPRIWSEDRMVPTSASAALGRSFDTPSTRFRRIASDRWIFRRRYRPLGMNSAFKGSLTLEGGRVIAQCRWPLGLAGFAAAWLLGWCSIGAFALMQPGEVRNDIGIPMPVFLFAGPAFMVLVFGALLWSERRAARRAIDEFVALGAPPSSR